MLIHYSIASYELLERKLTAAEKEEVYDVFYRTGKRMGLKDLPESFGHWTIAREEHLQNDLDYSKYTMDLFKQYRKHLGHFRYSILIEAQMLVVPARVKQLMQFRSFSLLGPVVPGYKLMRFFNLDELVKAILLPAVYKKQIKALDVVP